MFETILNPIFGPLLKMSPFWAIFIISFVIAVIISIVYKYCTDQELMKTLKQDMKDMQKDMKKFRHDPKKFMKMQKGVMSKNMQYMSKSMKPTLITFLPIIIIFGWLNANLAFEPLQPNDPFDVVLQFQKGIEGDVEFAVPQQLEIVGENRKSIENNFVKFTLKGQEGEYLLEFKVGDKYYTKNVIITNQQKYAKVIEMKKGDEKVKSISLGNKKLKAMKIGGWRIGWLGTYIILSLIFSLGLRKILKLH